MPKSPTVAAFYSGAGGLDRGFEVAGYDILLANDIDPVAIETHKKCGRARVAIAQDVYTLDFSAALNADVVIGGPPCQGFSVAGKMDPDDPRSQHVWTFLSLVSKIKPRAFVMENVKNLYSNKRWGELRDGLMLAANTMGYSTRLMLLNSADYGVPQSRERMFLIGVLGDVKIPELRPDPSQQRVSVREALSVLPRFGEPGNNTFCTAKITAASNPVLRRSPYAGMLFNGAGRPLDLERPCTTLPASMGGNRTPIIEQNLLDGDTTSWIREYHAQLLSGGKPLAFESAVSPHLRRITVEEAAILQGFPVGMRFSGTPSTQFRQIGNSVAPPLAEKVAEFLKPLISQADRTIAIPDLTIAELTSIATRELASHRGHLWAQDSSVQDSAVLESVAK